MAEMKFEDALEKLNKIVQALESGDLDLDQAIKKFEEGNKLRQFCEKKLKETERKIEVILKDETTEEQLVTKEVPDTEETTSGNSLF